MICCISKDLYEVKTDDSKFPTDNLPTQVGLKCYEEKKIKEKKESKHLVKDRNEQYSILVMRSTNKTKTLTISECY